MSKSVGRAYFPISAMYKLHVPAGHSTLRVLRYFEMQNNRSVDPNFSKTKCSGCRPKMMDHPAHKPLTRHETAR